jgi:antitoxin component YwqK of YwqJK toxin-antitoxin module
MVIKKRLTMNKYFDYLDFLLKVECSKQNLNYGETLKKIINNSPAVPNEEIIVQPLSVRANVSEPDSEGHSIVSVFVTGGTPPYTGVGDFEVLPGTHSFRVTDSLNQKASISVLAKTTRVVEPEVQEEPEVPTPPPVLNNYDVEFADGYFIGETKNGLMHGFGIRYWNNGKKWEGDWQNGKANGHIIVSFDGFVTYDGNMVDDLPNGKGKYIDSDTGRTYVGDWVDFCHEGQGELLSKDGEKIYEGYWKNNKYHGYGQSFLRGICRYEGAWEFGKRSGEGTAYDENGNIEYNGMWENNERMN